MPRVPASWLALLAPIPADVASRRSPVAPAGSPGAAPDSPIAGWESIVYHLSDMPCGTRIVLVTIDASGRPISASDHVYLRDTGDLDEHDAMDDRLPMRQESVGGRIEEDGSFRGTHWLVEGIEPNEDDGPAWTHTPREPTAAEVKGLMALVSEVMAREAAR